LITNVNDPKLHQLAREHLKEANEHHKEAITKADIKTNIDDPECHDSVVKCLNEVKKHLKKAMGLLRR